MSDTNVAVADGFRLVRVMHPNVLVRLDKTDDVTPAGIVLTTSVKPCTGVVVQLPETTDSLDGYFAVEVGSRVMFNPSVARSFEVEGERLSLVSWYDIDAVVGSDVKVRY